ncbi:hypothetical protein PSAC2689_60014 [Paraburkholderia sacchari]
MGIKLIAVCSKIVMQAQSDAMDIVSQLNMGCAARATLSRRMRPTASCSRAAAAAPT